MTALHFIITSSDDGVRRGFATVCPEARYASMAWTGVGTLERRLVSPELWKAFEHDLALGLDSLPTDSSSTLASMLLFDDYTRRSFRIGWLSREAIDVPPSQVDETLDGALRALGEWL